MEGREPSGQEHGVEGWASAKRRRPRGLGVSDHGRREGRGRPVLGVGHLVGMVCIWKTGHTWGN